jgi:hypothetical protein
VFKLRSKLSASLTGGTSVQLEHLRGIACGDAIERPRYSNIPLKAGLAWKPSARLHFSEKMDGVFAARCFGKSVLVGEQMPDGDFFAFDLVTLRGVDVRRWALRERLAALDTFNVKRPATGSGGGFLRQILARGGEGFVIADLECRYDDFGARVKCKRQDTFDCRVTAKHKSKMSIRLELDGTDAGWCPALYSRFDAFKVGGIVLVSCFKRLASGKLREPKLLRVRPDKV